MAVIWRLELKMNWTTNPMLETLTSDIMAEKQFYLLMKCLHFVNNGVIAAGASKVEKSWS